MRKRPSGATSYWRRVAPFSYVSGIPPGQTRSDKSFATYFGTEKKPSIQVADVRFSN